MPVRSNLRRCSDFFPLLSLKLSILLSILVLLFACFTFPQESCDKTWWCSNKCNQSAKPLSPTLQKKDLALPLSAEHKWLFITRSFHNAISSSLVPSYSFVIIYCFRCFKLVLHTRLGTMFLHQIFLLWLKTDDTEALVNIGKHCSSWTIGSTASSFLCG